MNYFSRYNTSSIEDSGRIKFQKEKSSCFGAITLCIFYDRFNIILIMKRDSFVIKTDILGI